MKHRFLAFCFLTSILYSQLSNAQTLFTYGQKQVSKAEFLAAFKKNNPETSVSEKSYREYLDLYVNYKLKVQSAYDQHLDKSPILQSELQNFKNNLADNYMRDDNMVQKMTDEAFTRSKKDIRAGLIYIPINVSDTLSAYTKAQEAYKQLQQGADFGNIAQKYSADPSVSINKGDIGYITAFTLPYPLENAIYNLKTGTCSAPVKTTNAYVILKAISERAAIGKITVAQVLLQVQPNATQEQKNAQKAKADSLYTLLQKGTSFQELVKKFSDDNLSSSNGGELPAFGVGKYNSLFEQTAFSLKKDGDIAPPFETATGFHIIKRISANPVAKALTEDESALLKQKVANDHYRITVAKEAMAQRIQQTIGFKKATYNQTHLLTYADSIYNNKKAPVFSDITPQTTLFTIGKEKYTVANWTSYLTKLNKYNINQSTSRLLQLYTEETANKYYRDHLDEYNKQYAEQVKEFKDGNMLFEAMQQNVWNKSTTDSTKLAAYYNQHTNRYNWAPGAAAVIFSANETAKVKELYQKLENNPHDWKKIHASYEQDIQADSGRFERNQLPVAANATMKANSLTPIQSDNNTSSFAYITQLYPNTEPRSFKDARGFVINDYQTVLENEWLNSLKKKYPVKINESVLASCWQ